MLRMTHYSVENTQGLHAHQYYIIIQAAGVYAHAHTLCVHTVHRNFCEQTTYLCEYFCSTNITLYRKKCHTNGGL